MYNLHYSIGITTMEMMMKFQHNLSYTCVSLRRVVCAVETCLQTNKTVLTALDTSLVFIETICSSQSTYSHCLIVLLSIGLCSPVSTFPKQAVLTSTDCTNCRLTTDAGRYSTSENKCLYYHS